jgi:hypothetical protein
LPTALINHRWSGGIPLAVFLGLAAVPDSICIEFLRTGILASDETLKVVPLARQWRLFHSLLDTGLVITNKKVIFYSTRHLGGLKKQREFLLRDLADFSYNPGADGNTWRFVLRDGNEVTLFLKIPEEDCQVIEEQLTILLAETGSQL